MTDIAYLPAHKLAGKLRSREIGCLELLEHHLARVERFNPALNAIIWTDLEAARERARQADQALGRGETWGPLHGLPMTIKESFDLAGAPTTWGIPRAQRPYRQDQCRHHGAAARGWRHHLRQDQCAADAGGLAELQRDLRHDEQSLGSDQDAGRLFRRLGGGARRRACALELGSDIGASIRNPAHYCGVLGHKPTWGIVPLRGQSPAARWPSRISPSPARWRARWRIWAWPCSVLAGPDELDAAGWRLAAAQAARRRSSPIIAWR